MLSDISNRLIMEWASLGTASKAVTCNYPLALTTLYCFISGVAGTSGDNGAWWGCFGYSMTTSQVTVKCNANSRCRCLIVGI